MKKKLLLLAILLVFCSIVLAENGCPDGFSPNQVQGQQAPSCYPIPGYNNQPQLPPPQGRWETRWGAVALGSTATGGGFGLVKNAKSKRSAEIAAMSQCHGTGGGTMCHISITYYNQCAVIAWGDKAAFSQGAGTIEIASKLAMKRCSSKDKNCKIVYADCSNAEWVSY